VCESATDRILLFGRAFLEDDSPAPAVERIRRGLRIHPYHAGGYGSSIAAYLEQRAPLAALTVPRETRFIEGSGLEINTIPPNDISYFKLLDTVVQQEPADALNPELAGQFAAVGIQKGKPFQPDSRMRRILEEAVALGNATARTIAMHPSSAEGFQFYGTRSAWLNPLMTTGFDFVRPSPSISTHGVEPSESSGALNLNARTSFFYFAIGVSPAMCMQLAGTGSQYLVAMMDATGSPLVGSRAYKVRLPPNVPAGAFWSITLYDTQTRSMLKTAQRFPRAGSQNYPTPAAQPSADGSFEIQISPSRPQGVPDGNWIQTDTQRGWFAILRLYSPLESFFDKSWRPSEIVDAQASYRTPSLGSRSS
jgi:hypothetical protein